MMIAGDPVTESTLHPALALCCALACSLGCQPGGSVIDDDDDELPEGPDPTEAMFDPERMLEVEIELDPGGWDELRRQTRTVGMLLEGECMEGPFESPFTYFPGAVTVDGEAVDQIGVRKKGFLGSLSETKPSLKIKFHEYVDGQQLSGLKRMTLNNGRQDPSVIKQCLGYQLLREAGVPAPRCNFAHVWVNGDDLGVYSHVESLRREFVSRNFPTDDGDLYEGTLSDFREGWTATFDEKYGDGDRSDLEAVVEALTAADDDLVAALEPRIDLDGFIDFWAMEVMIGHWDGYAGNTNNYYIYRDSDSGRFHFIPWGIDAIFYGTSPFGEDLPTAVVAQGALANRLYQVDETRERYLDRMLALLDECWNEDEILGEIDRMEALIAPVADPGGGADLPEYIELVRDFVVTRRDVIEGELAGAPPEVSEELRGSPCFVEVGEVHGTFETTWDSLSAPDPFVAGSGTMEFVWDGNDVEVTAVGAVAGVDVASNPGEAVVAMIAALPQDQFVVPWIAFGVDRVASGVSIELDWIDATGLLGFAGPSTGGQLAVAAYFGHGTLALDQASAVPGAPVTGTLDGSLVVGGN